MPMDWRRMQRGEGDVRCLRRVVAWGIRVSWPSSHVLRVTSWNKFEDPALETDATDSREPAEPVTNALPGARRTSRPASPPAFYEGLKGRRELTAAEPCSRDDLWGMGTALHTSYGA